MIDFTIFLMLINAIACQHDYLKSPIYKYRYETQDVMNTAASNIPVHGYHVVEGGYYPYQLGHGNLGLESGGLQGGIGGIGHGGLGINGGVLQGGIASGGGFARPGLGGQYILKPVGLLGGNGYNTAGFSGVGQGTGIGFAAPKFTQAPLLIGTGAIGFGGHHVTGGETVQKKDFNEQEKKHKDEYFDAKEGKEGGALNHGQAGYSKGEIAAKDAKSEAGQYNKADGEKNIFVDKKDYGGGKHYNKEGKVEEENTAKTGHKKGHKVKSFKTTHHKDESGKTEEYYDESHDEGGNYAFKGATEKSGEKGASSFQGGKEEERYKQGQAKEEGQFLNEHHSDKADSTEGKFGENKYAGAAREYANKNGADEQSLLGHQESNKYYKTHPFIVPFNH